ncbi:ATP-binding protein [Streptomyces sp. NPDC048584]|uniref:ATP-binding protein n=1 Tax=Streptomyces sp. NPDC048584 TaxID=3365573 RepID=UPI003718B74E
MNQYLPPALPTLLAPRSDRYAMRLTVGEHSAGHVRRIVRSLLREWEMTGLFDSVELGVTELLTNVVRHVPDRHCALLLLRLPGGVRVEVADESDELPRVPVESALDAENGRGLALLAAVTDKWGVDPEPCGGKTVWFECAVEARA